MREAFAVAQRTWGTLWGMLGRRNASKQTAARSPFEIQGTNCGVKSSIIWCDDRKGDLLELLLGAASILLDRGEQVQEASRHLRYCLHLIRLLVEDCARTLEEIHVASHPAGCLLKGQKDGHHVTSRHCPRCHQQVFAKWQYATWTGAISALFNHQCSM